MDIAIDVFKAFLGLYVDIFKKYTLAASITTLLFVIGYYVWMKINKERSIEADAVWKQPAFVLFIGWCILTPLLGLIISMLTVLKNILTVVAGIYVHVFKMYPEAASIVTVVFLAAYFIWKLILKKKGACTNGLRSRPGIVLLATWIIVTPIVGLVIKWAKPNRENLSQVQQPTKQSQVKQQTTDAEQPASGDKK